MWVESKGSWLLVYKYAAAFIVSAAAFSVLLTISCLQLTSSGSHSKTSVLL